MRTSHSLKPHNGLPFIFEDNIFLYLSGPVEQIYTHDNDISYVFNVSMITPFLVHVMF